jgi:hypothetical protein
MPSDPRASYEKFNYLLRPSKQVERKLIIEAVQRLRDGGFRIPDYTYVGLGSPYYADFVLFHKYLYLDRMVCAEASDIPRRMRFNKPFSFVRLRMEKIGDVLPQLSRDAPHFVWLDYDTALSEDVVQDLTAAVNVLAADSILLVTVDVEPKHQVEGEQSEAQRLRTLIRDFPSVFGRYTDRTIRRSDFSYNGLPQLVSDVLGGLFRVEAARRPGFQFLQMLNFVYADGAQMLTIGGVIGTRETSDRFKRSQVMNLPFVTRRRRPVKISVPPLTPREKDWLDQNVTESFRATQVRFELRSPALRSFAKYRRHYPNYYESLM